MLTRQVHSLCGKDDSGSCSNPWHVGGQRGIAESGGTDKQSQSQIGSIPLKGPFMPCASSSSVPGDPSLHKLDNPQHQQAMHATELEAADFGQEGCVGGCESNHINWIA